jgi:hypothetical protein
VFITSPMSAISLLRRADLAQNDDPGMQRGAEVRVHAEAELIERPARPSPVARVKARADDRGFVPARPQAPRGLAVLLADASAACCTADGGAALVASL